MEWQPIETAPRDGRWVIGLFDEDVVMQMKWYDGGGSYVFHWMGFGQWTPCDPTHWMPLPAPPAA